MAGWTAPAERPEFRQAAGVTPAQLAETLQRLQVDRRPRAERRGIGELGWLLLTTLRAQDEEVLRLQQALEGKMQECMAQAEARAVAQAVVTSQAERAQELTRQCEVLMARVANRRRLKQGRQPVTTAQVRAVTATPFWDPEAWDGTVEGSSSFSEEEEGEREPPVAHARPVQELKAIGNEMQPEVVRSYKTSELQEIVKSFRQEPGEGVLSWLVRVWDNAGNTVLLLYYELRQLGLMAQDAQVRAEMSTLGPPAEGQPESPSLYRWLAEAVGVAYPSVGELEALVSPWKMISEGIQALRQLGIAWAVSTGGTEGPNDMLVSKSMKVAFIRTAPDELKPSLLAVVMAADGRAGELAATLMQLGTALAGARPKAV
ncbi:Friend virus susceptibility protein 1-like [Gopherus evgoodei]|uniref:Friend virus susceptibility protein 1-like n=1 Tax=Gopherus evgoodei TaxID=1825980 RepID=UPI0011D01DD7|nr:Friend virus susceptibility protein 1-like [Gopherus evgoodei]